MRFANPGRQVGCSFADDGNLCPDGALDQVSGEELLFRQPGYELSTESQAATMSLSKSLSNRWERFMRIDRHRFSHYFISDAGPQARFGDQIHFSSE